MCSEQSAQRRPPFEPPDQRRGRFERRIAQRGVVDGITPQQVGEPPPVPALWSAPRYRRPGRGCGAAAGRIPRRLRRARGPRRSGPAAARRSCGRRRASPQGSPPTPRYGSATGRAGAGRSGWRGGHAGRLAAIRARAAAAAAGWHGSPRRTSPRRRPRRHRPVRRGWRRSSPDRRSNRRRSSSGCRRPATAPRRGRARRGAPPPACASAAGRSTSATLTVIAVGTKARAFAAVASPLLLTRTTTVTGPSATRAAWSSAARQMPIAIPSLRAGTATAIARGTAGGRTEASRLVRDIHMSRVTITPATGCSRAVGPAMVSAKLGRKP